MSYAKKLYCLIAIALSGLLILGAMCIVQIGAVYDAANYANENSLPSIEVLDEAAEAMFRMRIAVWKHIAAADNSDKDSAMHDIQAAEQRIAAALTRYEQEDITDAADRALLEKDRSTLAGYYAMRDAVLKLSVGGDADGARRKQLSIQAQIKPADNALKEHRNYNVKLAQESSKRAAATRRDATIMSGVIALAVIAGIMLAGVLLVRKLVHALGDAIRTADTIAAGDLSQKVHAVGTDEIGQLQRALSLMSDKLTTIIGEVQQGAQAIQVASGEIASGNMDLSGRTEQQAGALEETASSMEELTSAVQQSADNAAQVHLLANEASKTAEQGGHVVSQVVDTMAAISSASTRIADITGVIDSIAFQTNILALNAAVEAARAGDQGRGFAVVAAEVRSLAQRSAAAAKEIKALIDNAAAQVEQGETLVGEAGNAMLRIVGSVARVAGVIGEISESSREQSAGIQQVNEALTQMDSMTQQNAALVEQSAAAAISMREQADVLTKLVGQFRVQPATDSRLQPERKPLRHAAKMLDVAGGDGMAGRRVALG